ncbi:MAG: hypothetical protein ACI4IF_07845 [Acutalibacteraceae bacterium]
MKKIISIMLIVGALVTCVIPTTAFAGNNTNDDAYFTQEEFEALNPIYAEYEESLNTRSTGLIIKKSLAIAKDGTKLVIKGYTYGSDEVIKCGFKEVVVQRRANSSASWSYYKTYKDLYSESTKYTLNKSLTVATGYQYRVTAIHYAKKSLLSTQKIEVVTGYLTF